MEKASKVCLVVLLMGTAGMAFAGKPTIDDEKRRLNESSEKFSQEMHRQIERDKQKAMERCRKATQYSLDDPSCHLYQNQQQNQQRPRNTDGSDIPR